MAMSTCNVLQMQCLDEDGYWTKRTIFLNMDSNFKNGLKKVAEDKSISDSYSTVRSVLYVY